MKNISRVALLAALFSISAPLFSQDGDTPPANTKSYVATVAKFPKRLVTGIFISIPKTISENSYQWVIDKFISKVSYLQGGRLAKYSPKIGFALVYITAAALLYKLYTKSPVATNNSEDVFDFNYESNETNNV